MPGSVHVVNANIWTADPRRPWAHSILIEDGRVVDLDVDRDDLRHRAGDGSIVTIDAAGRTLLPGLIDSHMHLAMGGEGLNQIDLSHITSREAFEHAIADAHRQLPQGQWLIARGWSESNWSDNTATVDHNNRSMPDSTWLEAAEDRPTIAYRSDFHTAVVNNAVLDIINTEHDPAGGAIDRDPSTNRPTGLLLEAAVWELVNPLIPQRTDEQLRDDLLAAQQHCLQLGLTTVGTMEYQHTIDAAFLPLQDSLTLRCCITLLDGRTFPIDLSYARRFNNVDRLAIIGCKAFVDGTLGSRTAYLLDEYADDAGNRGMLLEAAREGVLQQWFNAVIDTGLSPSLHAIGDGAVRMVLDVIEAAEAAGDVNRLRQPPTRPRLEHVQQIDPADINRFAGRIASMQPLHKAYDGRIAARRLGAERLVGTFPFRDLLRAGALLAFGSDWPVVSCDPMLGIRAAVTGLTIDDDPFLAEQNLTAEEAIAAYTRDAAAALNRTDCGALKPGCHGDVILLDIDPFRCDWVQQQPRVVATIVGGEVVYADATAIELPESAHT